MSFHTLNICIWLGCTIVSREDPSRCNRSNGKLSATVAQVDTSYRWFMLPYRGVIFKALLNFTETTAEIYLKNLYV